MTDLILRQPVRLQLGGGLDKDGKRMPARFVSLASGLNRSVSDEVANHPYILAHLKASPRPPAPTSMFSSDQLKMLDQLGLSPEQKKTLSELTLTPEQRAALTGGAMPAPAEEREAALKAAAEERDAKAPAEERDVKAPPKVDVAKAAAKK